MELDFMATSAPRLNRLKIRSAICAWLTGILGTTGKPDLVIILKANAFSLAGNFINAEK